jgi:hypothetical protein
MDDAKRFSLGEREFLEFAALIRLSVSCARHLLVRLQRVAGPLAGALIGPRCAEELHGADDKKEKKHTLTERTEHDALPLRKSPHGTMVATHSAIRFDLCSRTG